MCEICINEGENYLFKNGIHEILVTNKLYRVFKDAVAPIKLCHLHSIELFRLGERRFMREHINFARSLASVHKFRSHSDQSLFGI